MTRMLSALVTVVALSVSAWAEDGVEIVIEHTVHEPDAAQTRTQVVRSDGKKLSMTAPSKADPEGKTSTAIFTGDAIVVVDHPKKEWDQFDKELAKRLGEMQKRAAAGMPGVPGGPQGAPAMSPEDMERAKEQLKKTLEDMPPEAPAQIRKMVEEQLKRLEEATKPKDQAAGAAAPKPRVVREGTEKVGDVECVKWGVFVGEKRVKDVCAVAPGDAGAAARALPAFRAFARYVAELRELMPAMARMQGTGDTLSLELEEIQGFPWSITEYDEKGAKRSAFRVKSAKDWTVDAAAFAPPAGYTRRKSPFEKPAPESPR